MIRVRYSPNCLSVEGHAEYAPVGRDIVCSAASALFNAAVASLEELDKKHTIPRRQGDGEASVSYLGRKGKEAQTIIKTVVIGYRCLAYMYPNNIKVEAMSND